MILLSLTTALLLTQSDPNEAAARAAAAAERAALAAEKAAEAAQKIAEATTGTPAAPAAAAPTGEPAPELWKGLIGVSFIALSGNAESITGIANAQLDRKFGNWAAGARANGAYGQTRRATGGDEVSALRAALTMRGDRSVVSFASIFVQAGLDADHVKSIELRGFGELGASLRFYERKEGDLEKLYIRADLAFRFQQEERYQYFPTATTPANTGLPDATFAAPRIAAVFRYAMNKDIKFSEEVEFLPNVLGPSRVLINNTTKLSARLTETLSISGSFLANFDSSPAPGNRDLDTSLSLGLEAAF